MKFITSLILALIFLASCGTPSGSNSEAKHVGPGNVENTQSSMKDYWFEVDGKRIDAAEVPYGSKVVLVIKDAEGFKKSNGKVLVDAAIEVLNEKNQRVVLLDKLFDKKYPEGMPVELFEGRVEVSLKCQTPLQINKKYKLVFILKDKSSESKIVVSDLFDMKKTPGLAYKESGLTSDGFFFTRNSETETISNKTLAAGDTLYAYCTGLSGLDSKNGVVRADASIVLLNAQGDTLANFEDLYKEYEKDGMPAETVSELIYMQLVMPATLQKASSYKAIFTVKDKMAESKLIAEYMFECK